MSLEFKFIQPGDKDFNLYKTVLSTVYGADSKRVKQKGAVEKEYLMGCLVAIQAGVPVARCSLYNNPNHYYNKLRFGCIGNYECVNDMSIALAFMQKIIATFKAFRLPYIVGPMDQFGIIIPYSTILKNLFFIQKSNSKSIIINN